VDLKARGTLAFPFLLTILQAVVIQPTAFYRVIVEKDLIEFVT